MTQKNQEINLPGSYQKINKWANIGFDSSLEVLNYGSDFHPCSQKIKEPTLNHISFACSYMKANGSLKIFKNPKLEVLLSLNRMKKIGGFQI